MDLRALRTRIAVLCAVLSAVVAGVLVVVSVQIGSARILEDADRDVRVLTVAGLVEGADDTWWVNSVEGTSTPQGAVQVEAPVWTLAGSAMANGEASLRFAQDGSEYLAHARRAADGVHAAVAVLHLDPYLDEITALTLQITTSAVAALLVLAVVVWWCTGRLLRPVRRALDRQREFVADAAHEIRTPLAVIQGSASFALSRPRPTPAYLQSLAEVHEAARRAGDGVTELLEMARLQSGHDQLRRAPLRLDLLAEEVVSATRVEGTSVVTRPGPAAVVDGDLALLRLAVDNLVRNAARRGTHVEVSVGTAGRHAVLAVADDGPGFTPTAMATAFQRFRRGDQHGSYGLGLAIVDHIVTAHHGRCSAHNRVSGGAVVEVHLPLHPRFPGEPAPRPVRPSWRRWLRTGRDAGPAPSRSADSGSTQGQERT